MKKKTLSGVYFAAFLLALSLLTFTTINGARALPSEESEVQTTEMTMHSVNVAVEEGSEAEDSWEQICEGPDSVGEAFSAFLQEDITVGKTYYDDFRVKNTGDMDEYVRVEIYRYWLKKADDEQGRGFEDFDTSNTDKDLNLDGSLVELVLGDSENWIEDDDNSTDERLILFYTQLLEADESTDVFLKGFRLNGDIKKEYTLITKEETVDEASGEKIWTIIYDYAYNGRQFKIQIIADCVQSHHAEDAIKSAWGREVSISDEDGTLSLS